MGVTQAWMVVMGIYGAVMAVLGLYHIKMLPSGGSAKEVKSMKEGFRTLWDVIKTFFQKKYIILYISFIIIFRFAEGFAIKIAPLFFKAAVAEGGLGMSTKDIGVVYGGFGSAAFVVGSLLAGSKESPTEKIWIDDIAYKSYRGMGSIASMKLGSKERYGQKEITNPEKFVPEGVEGLVIFKGPIKDIIYQNVGGIKSGMGYVGARNIKTLQKKCLFIEMTNASLRESHPHSLNKFHNSPNYKGTKNG